MRVRLKDKEGMKKARGKKERKTTPAPGKPSKVQVDQIKRAGEENSPRFFFFYYQAAREKARDKEKSKDV